MKYTKKSKRFKSGGGWFWKKKVDDNLDLIKKVRKLFCNNPIEYFDIIENELNKLKEEYENKLSQVNRPV